MIGNKPSIYNAPSVYNQGGGGGGGGGNYEIASALTILASENYFNGLCEFNDRFEFICKDPATNHYVEGGLQPLIDPIEFSEMETLETSIHMFYVNQKRNNRADIFASSVDLTTGNSLKKWVNVRYLNASNELYLFADLSGFMNSVYRSSPDIINKEITLNLKYTKSTSKVILTKTGGTSWTLATNTDNSKLSGDKIGVAFGFNLFEGLPFSRGTIIYKKGTFVKYNGQLVWGAEE